MVKRSVSTLLLALLSLSPGVARDGGDGTRDSVETAYLRARTAVLAETNLQAGSIWNLRQGLSRHPDPELAAFLDRAAAELAGTRYERLVLPDAPRIQLPEELGRGLEQLTSYSMAPLGIPEERALRWVADYAAPDASGYTLTHQFLYIEFAEQTGLELPELLAARRDALLGRIEAEQSAATGFSDLFAERVAILMLFGDPQPEQATGWIEVLLRTQLANGHWDSRGDPAAPGSIHTTGLCAAALMVKLSGD